MLPPPSADLLPLLDLLIMLDSSGWERRN